MSGLFRIGNLLEVGRRKDLESIFIINILLILTTFKPK